VKSGLNELVNPIIPEPPKVKAVKVKKKVSKTGKTHNPETASPIGECEQIDNEGFCRATATAASTSLTIS